MVSTKRIEESVMIEGGSWRTTENERTTWEELPALPSRSCAIYSEQTIDASQQSIALVCQSRYTLNVPRSLLKDEASEGFFESPAVRCLAESCCLAFFTFLSRLLKKGLHLKVLPIPPKARSGLRSRRNIEPSEFRRFYDRNDLPIQVRNVWWPLEGVGDWVLLHHPRSISSFPGPSQWPLTYRLNDISDHHTRESKGMK